MNQSMDAYLDIYNQFKTYYGAQKWWPASSELEMMIGAVLVQNTAWRNVELAINQLRPYLTPESLSELSTEALAQLIRPSGFFRIKEKRIRSLLTWFQSYDYDINRVLAEETYTLRKELLDVHGIGPETADSILLYACQRPVFVIDTYTRRILSRYGYDPPKGYDAFQSEIEAHLPHDVNLFNEFHALFVAHAKKHCRVKPICEGCPLLSNCEQNII